MSPSEPPATNRAGRAHLVIRGTGDQPKVLHNPSVRSERVGLWETATVASPVVIGTATFGSAFAFSDRLSDAAAGLLLMGGAVGAGVAAAVCAAITWGIEDRDTSNQLALKKIPARHREWVVRAVAAADKADRALRDVRDGPLADALRRSTDSLLDATWRFAVAVAGTGPVEELARLAERAGTSEEQGSVAEHVEAVSERVRSMALAVESSADEIARLHERARLEAALVAMSIEVDDEGLTGAERSIRDTNDRLLALTMAIDEVTALAAGLATGDTGTR